MVVGIDRVAEIKQMLDLGYNKAQIASQFNIEKETINRYLRFYGKPDIPKILLFDIETLPMEVLVWGLYKQRIPYENVLKEWCIVSWAAKWLFDANIMSDVISPQAAKERNDGRIIGKIWSLIDSADIVIGHNVKRFDIRKLNARFMLHKLQPPMPYQVIDTLKETQKHMGFSSHRLDYLTRIITGTHKIKTEYGLWKRCAGIGGATPDIQKTALQEMVKYNERDIIILEDLYVELRPWIKSHPNLGLYYSDIDNSRCPNCGSIDLGGDEKTYKTMVGRFKAYRCKSCGAICRSRYSDLSKKERKELVAPVAR